MRRGAAGRMPRRNRCRVGRRAPRRGGGVPSRGTARVFRCAGLRGLARHQVRVQLPDEEGAVGRLSRPRFGLPSRLDTWSFIQGMTLDGLFVIGMSVLAAAAMPEYAALAAGAALALRYIAEILLESAGGALAERYGARHVLMLLSAASAAGLAVIGAGLLWSGAALVVMLRGLIQPLPAPVVAMENPGLDRVPALARLASAKSGHRHKRTSGSSDAIGRVAVQCARLTGGLDVFMRHRGTPLALSQTPAGRH
jgi:hypothetical protein